MKLWLKLLAQFDYAYELDAEVDSCKLIKDSLNAILVICICFLVLLLAPITALVSIFIEINEIVRKISFMYIGVEVIVFLLIWYELRLESILKEYLRNKFPKNNEDKHKPSVIGDLIDDLWYSIKNKVCVKIDLTKYRDESDEI